MGTLLGYGDKASPRPADCLTRVSTRPIYFPSIVNFRRRFVGVRTGRLMHGTRRGTRDSASMRRIRQSPKFSGMWFYTGSGRIRVGPSNLRGRMMLVSQVTRPMLLIYLPISIGSWGGTRLHGHISDLCAEKSGYSGSRADPDLYITFRYQMRRVFGSTTPNYTHTHTHTNASRRMSALLTKPHT